MNYQSYTYIEAMDSSIRQLKTRLILTLTLKSTVKLFKNFKELTKNLRIKIKMFRALDRLALITINHQSIIH